jgi:hypothetical protein
MADASIFGRLKRLFSTGTIVRNVGGKKLKVADTDNIQSFINRRGVDRYNRIYTTQSGGYGSAHGRTEQAAAFHGARLQLFRDYDMMDNDAIIASVLDIYADESTIKDEFGQILAIKSGNNNVKEILHNLFYDILNIDFNLWPWVRNMCKYGDFFLYLDIHEDYGIVNVVPLSVYETMRIEGEDITNPFSVKFRLQNDFLQLGKVELDNYEVAHFRLLADTNFLPYGKAMIENGRRVWKQLQLMEDAMLIHRIMRAPDKRKFLVDVGNIPPNEIDQFMNRLVEKMKKAPLMDPKTGDYNLRYNMMNITEDFYLPVRGKDSGTDIQTMQGLAFNAIEDIEYLRKKLMAAFKVPKSFIGYEEDLSGKATLASEDVRFARTIERIQRIMISELTKIAIIHLYVQGFRDEDLIDFELTISSPSMIYEQEKLSLWSEKLNLATTVASSKLLSEDWAYKNIFEMTEEEIQNERMNIESDVRRQAEMKRVEMQISQPPLDAGNQSTEEPLIGGEEESEPLEEPDETEESEDSEESAESSEGDEPEEELEETVDVVDEDFMKALKELEMLTSEVSDEELEEAKMGRPRKVSSYSTDNHVHGRDPLGRKSAFEKRQQERDTVKRKSLVRSLTKELRDMKDVGSVKQILTEDEVK